MIANDKLESILIRIYVTGSSKRQIGINSNENRLVKSKNIPVFLIEKKDE